jgi:3-oxoacyl-[acyl-carrier-protein] synthase II
MRAVNITGTGLVTSLGKSVDETWNALLAGRFIRDHTRITGYQPVASRIFSIARSAAHEAIESANWTSNELGEDSTALIVGTSKGPIESWMNAPPVVAYGTKEVSSNSIGLHEISESLAREFRFGHGPRATLSAACASGLHALIHATMLIESGVADRALVVAAEASVHPLFVGSFKRLGVLPPEGFGCRPFDQDRAGFLMSESAAALCLESTSSSTPRHAPRIDRFALGADAIHLTGVDPGGATLRRLLAQVIDNRSVDLIHAHGTATTMNDPVELAAIEDSLVPGDRPTWLYSHKGALGHSLGAAGLISIVLNLQSHHHGIVPPNVQTRNPIPTHRAALSREAAKATIRRSIAIAIGFGGPTAVVSCVSA